MTLEDIPPGQTIMSIPYELSLDLGSDNVDPAAPALAFLTEHFLRGRWDGGVAKPYLDLIPTLESGDCTTTDFFSGNELDLLQCPLVKSDTAKRTASLAARYCPLEVKDLTLFCRTIMSKSSFAPVPRF